MKKYYKLKIKLDQLNLPCKKGFLDEFLAGLGFEKKNNVDFKLNKKNTKKECDSLIIKIKEFLIEENMDIGFRFYCKRYKIKKIDDYWSKKMAEEFIRIKESITSSKSIMWKDEDD